MKNIQSLETKTMLKLKTEMIVGTVIRYKNFVLVADFVISSSGLRFLCSVWQPIETEEEVNEDFMNLRLKNIAKWENQRFDTEGEALRAGMDFIERNFNEN